MPPNPSLKQRLAALSLAPSSPASPYTSDSPRSPPLSGKRKAFAPPWTKRQPERPATEEQEARNKVQDVMGRVVFQAGVDFEFV